MSSPFKYGNEISYDFSKVGPEDYDMLQVFSCGNEKLDQYIHNEVITETADHERIVNCVDGLHFKVVDLDTDEIIGFVSLAASGIIHKENNYTHVLPAVKIDVFAIDTRYQKVHFDLESESSNVPDEHYYFSDHVMGTVIKHCRIINEDYALVDFIVLYADIKAERFYRRNLFGDYREFMEKEKMQEINKNIPMYMDL